MKLPLQTSFAALCAVIGSLIQDVANLGGDVSALDSGKADKASPVTFTIPTSGWGTDSTVPSHPNYYDVTVSGMTAKDIVAVDVAPGSTAAARAANFTGTQSYDGKFRLRARNIPKEAITAQYRAVQTEEE